MSNLRVFSLLLVICCCCSALFAQDKKKTGIESWDANGDGLLQENEIPEKARPMMKRWAETLELNPNKPLPLKTLLAAKGDKKKDLRKKVENKADSAKKKKVRKLKQEASGEAPAKQNRKVAGFGKQPTAKELAEAVDEAEKKGDKKKKDSKEDKRAERRERQYRMLAKSLMFQNDKNKNGKLERNEWTRLKGNPAAADKNKDNVLTSEELAAHLKGYGSRENEPRRRSTFSRSTRAKTDRNGKSYRFLSPHERLPDGIPTWFTEKDENLDGQLSLIEYVAEITADKLAKFEQFDLNGDGFIEAKEYLKATN